MTDLSMGDSTIRQHTLGLLPPAEHARTLTRAQLRSRSKLDRSAHAGFLRPEDEVAGRVERLQPDIGDRHELAELERRPLVPAGLDVHAAPSHRRPQHVHLAVLARERRLLLRRLDLEVAARVRGAPERQRPLLPALAKQQRRGICITKTRSRRMSRDDDRRLVNSWVRLRTRERGGVLGLDVAGVPAPLAPDSAFDADGEVQIPRGPGQAHRRAPAREAAQGEDHKGKA